MKKSLALVLAVCMLLGMLSGCGDSTATASSEAHTNSGVVSVSEAPEDVPAQEAASSEAPEDASVAESSVAEGYDTYTGAAPASESAVTYPIEEDGVVLSYWTPFVSNMPDIYETISDIPATNKIAENVGVTIEWNVVSGMDMFVQFNLMAASGDYCDMIQAAVECYSGGSIGALNDGVLADLTDYMTSNAPDYLAAHESRGSLKDIVTGDGRYACLWGCYDRPEASQGYVIRKDWLDELELDIPVTYEDYFNVLCAFKNAYGCTDAFLMSSACQDESHTPGGFGSPGYKSDVFGTGTDLYQVDGVVKSSFLEEAYRDYLREMHRWYEAGIFSSDFSSISSRGNDESRTKLIASNNTGIWSVGANNIGVHRDAIGGNAEVIGIADPVLNEGDINHFSTAMTVNSQCDVGISTACENIEAALKYLNYYFTDEGIRMYNYGIEGETYNLVDGNVKYTDLILNPATGYTPFTMTEAYVLVGGIVSVTYGNRQLDFTDGSAQEAWDIWNSTQDTLYVLPEGLALTADETSEVATLQSDIYTYAAECVPKFFNGEMDVETDWDGFVEKMKNMGIEKILDIYQGALERYNEL